MSRRRDYTIVALILVAAWALWLQRLGLNDHDDMLSNELLFAHERLTTILFHNPWADQSPLYFLYLRAIRLFGESPWVIQFVNGLLLTVSLLVTGMLAGVFSESRRVGIVAVLLGAASPASLWLVRGGRMYSLQLLFSAVAALCVLRYRERRPTADLVWFGVVAVLSIYTHFFGFLITALLFLPLLLDAATEVRRGLATGRVAPWRPLLPLAATTGAVFIAVVPQVVRAFALVTTGVPTRPNISMPALSAHFVDRVGWFWFVNSSWGALGPGEQLVTAVYMAATLLLALAGVVAVRRRNGLSAAFWILLPVAAVGLAAARMDVRDRYFAWTLPLIWTAIATGGVGPLPGVLRTGAPADIARGIRAALLVAVIVGSLWLTWNKLPERNGEWTKLMTGVDQLYRPSMAVYMPPGSPIGIPRIVALQQHLSAGLADVQPLDGSTHDTFVGQMDAGREFVFLVYTGQENDELRWRIGRLEERAYHHALIPVYAATAHLFTRDEATGFADAHQLTDVSPAGIATWAAQARRARTASRPPAPDLGGALVARVATDGRAAVGRLYISQRGENGAWRLGPREWDAVESARLTSGAVEQSMIAAHPAAGSVLAVAMAPRPLRKSLRLTYGLADTAFTYRDGAPVEVALFINGTRVAAVSCQNTPGWKTVTVDTSPLDGQAADIVVLVTTANDTSRHFAFRLDPSASATETPAQLGTSETPPPMTGGHRLSDNVERLHVYRAEPNQRVEGSPDGRTYGPADMHERTGAAGEGSAHRVWAFGPLLWDSVGSTRQRGGGEVRKGIWAHPRNGSTLLIEARGVRLGPVLRGFFGLSDYAVEMAGAGAITAPLRFRVKLDGRDAFATDQPRASGWHELAVPAGDVTRTHDLTVEIASDSDKWGHFVFDLWSE